MAVGGKNMATTGVLYSQVTSGKYPVWNLENERRNQ